MPVLNLVILVLIVVAIVIILNRIFKKKNKLLDFNDGNVEQILPPSKIDTSTSSNYTYSIWFYVEDWNYKYGQQKVLLKRIDNEGNPCPMIKLDAFQNDLIVSVQTYPDTSVSGDTNTQLFNCSVKNVPIQSWVNALVSINGRTLDVYLDGKLVKTCVMPGVAKTPGNNPVVITPNGGFAGFTANTEYWAKSATPQDAWNIYKKGNGASTNMFNKYKIKVALLEDNREKTSFKAPF